MERITEKREDGRYVAPLGTVSLDGEGARGAAIDKLGAFEDAVELVQRQLDDVAEKLERLKAQGRLRGAQGQQLLAQKLAYSSTLSLMGARDE